MNLSQLKRERMLACLDTIRKKHKDDDIILCALGEIENELTSKKYGLVWEKHEETVDVQMQDNIPVFTELTDKEICTDTKNNYNFLLEGDNLHSLRLLEKTHCGRIDVIYIDPPYNTKNKDFVYDDIFVDETDGYRHSKWISFMAERLKIAQSLLSKSGCIFISIDANEFAQLKLLCDSVFGEDNFIGCLIWRKKTGGGQTDEFFVTEHEYIMAYRKSMDFKWIEYAQEANPDDYKYEDKKGQYKIVKLEKWGSSAHREDRPTMYSAIIDPDGNAIYPVAPDGKDGRWRVGLDRLDKLIKSDCVHWQKDKAGRWIPYEKVYFSEAKGKLLKSRSILYDVAETGTATKLLTSIFGRKDVFENPKPVEIIKFILKHTTGNVVLDFFAGSGTTAQAVLEFNVEEDVERRFILCTNNENRICENVTYQRIKTIVTGRREDGSIYSHGIPANLKYYRTDFISKEADDVSTELLGHIIEMVQLEHGVKIDGKEYFILLNDEEADGLERHWEEYPDISELYISKDVLLTASQNALFGCVPVHIIPDYYFNFELREVGEVW